MPAAAVSLPVSPSTDVVRRRVSCIEADPSSATCWFSSQDSLKLGRFIGGFVRAGDEIEFDPRSPLPLKECRVIQHRAQRPNELYFGSIGYAAQPKADKRGEYYVRAEVPESRLGLKQIHLRNEAVRDYFYFANRRRPGCEEETLYDLLGTAHSASPTDLRLAWKVRLLELETDHQTRDLLRSIERAFNLLAHPDCTVELNGPPRPYRAELLEGDERDAAWAKAVDVYAGYENYRLNCAPRQIRIFRLRPVASDRGNGS